MPAGESRRQLVLFNDIEAVYLVDWSMMAGGIAFVLIPLAVLLLLIAFSRELLFPIGYFVTMLETWLEELCPEEMKAARRKLMEK